MFAEKSKFSMQTKGTCRNLIMTKAITKSAFFFMFTLFFHPEIIYITHKCIDSSKVKRLTKISQVAKNVQDAWVFTCNIVEILKYLQTCLGPQRLGHVMFYHFFTGGSVPSPRYQANWPTSLKCQRAFITHTITNVCSEIGLLK